jgi:hypothetical protein
MEGAVDRVEVSQALTVREVIVPLTVVAVPETPALQVAQRPAARHARKFDDIPSVVRALLVGYDEV